MILEDGKSYVTRNGEVVRIVKEHLFGTWRFYGDNGFHYNVNGFIFKDQWSDFDLIREHKPKPEGQTLTMSLDLSDMRNEMERLNRATKAFLEEYDRD